MRAFAVLGIALAITGAVLATSASPALADTFYGTVTHVSSGNIKVKDANGKEVSFLLAPSFDKIFSDDGKTTYQMKDVKPGRHVKIVYHQQLGVRYCDQIIFTGH